MCTLMSVSKSKHIIEQPLTLVVFSWTSLKDDFIQGTQQFLEVNIVT